MFMAQGSYTVSNASVGTTGQRTGESVPKYLGTWGNTGHHPDLDYLNCVDGFQNSTTIKRLSLKRRPKAASSHVETSSQWHSAESLSPSSDGSRLLGMSTTARGRPPLPPAHGSSSDNNPQRNEASAASQFVNEFRPKPATRSLASHKQSPTVEKTNVETDTYWDHEVTNQPPPQPRPRRRLASFGGVSSPGSLSPFTGLGAYNQNNNGNKPSGTENDNHLNLTLSLGSRGSTGCLRMSPQSSGRATPVAGIGPVHLQHVRDQMVIALQRLKELEEQVKIIPILQVKISVLQEEKRQLASQLKYQSDNEELIEVIWNRTCSTEQSDMENKTSAEEGSERIEKSEHTGLGSFRQLTEEMQELEETVKGGHLERGNHDNATMSATVGTDKNTDITLFDSTKENARQVQTRSVATEVSEVNLGIDMEREGSIGALKDKISHLEAELKESALQTEMSRLKLELQAAGARNRADKASLARPSTASTGVEARPQTTSQGVGNHAEVRDASTGQATEARTVGVSCCGPDLKNALIGPDVPMSHWLIRERVETQEKCVGTKINHQSVACGDCSVDVVVCEAKEMVSQGLATDPVRGVDLGVMASPQTASQRTNTESSSVTRFTNTSHAFNTDSCTNTLLSTQDKHTNTTQTVTRTACVGNRVRDIGWTPETRTVGVGTANWPGNAMKQGFGIATKLTRDTGVGFTNINDNFLVGLKTRNMASGPSHLPDPITTRSIGVGEGKIHTASASCSTAGQSVRPSTQTQWDSELNHYIQTMQRLLGENGDLLTEAGEQYSARGNNSSKLFCNKAAALDVPEAHRSASQPPGTEFQSSSQFSADSAQGDKANAGVCQQGGNESEVKRMIQMLEQQTSSALQGRSTNAVLKKQKSDQVCSSNRRSMRFMRATAGLDPKASYEPSANEKFAPEEVERGGNKLKDVSHHGIQAKKNKGGSIKGLKSHTQRFRLSEKLSSACQVLKTHLNDSTAASSRELQDCLETLQREWFSVSSHKSAVPDTLEEYLSAFRVISPSVLQHIANMTDSNGNTALHYSVSHSNFGIVNKLLDADVCNVNQQNKAGYTPIMLAALAAVETPEDMRVVEQLFTKGDVDAKASQAGQTALMLAVSHGRMDMVQALLAQGAEVNLQDDEGSTALMCASEHGHADIVKVLLSQPDCNATLTDSDDSTALSIALEAGHNDIAVLLYAHANFSRGQTGAAARHSSSSRNSFE